MQYMIKFQSINSAKAADILDIQQKTASRLLAKAEKNHLLESEGRTKNKIQIKACFLKYFIAAHILTDDFLL